MQYTQQFISAADIEGPSLEAENDDIDRLFGKLRKVEPPTSLVSDILSSISRLPKDIHTRKDISNINPEDYLEKRAGREAGKVGAPAMGEDSKGTN